MYEQNTPVARRVITLVIAFVIIVAVLWLLVWLIFFRGHHSSTVAPAHHGTSRNHSSDTSSPAPSNSSADTTGSGNIGTPATTTSPHLANTGPGDIITPVVVTVATGTIAYQLRLHRKLGRQRS